MKGLNTLQQVFCRCKWLRSRKTFTPRLNPFPSNRYFRGWQYNSRMLPQLSSFSVSGWLMRPSTRVRILNLKTQTILCGLAFPPHVSDGYTYRKRKLLKTLSRVETFQNTNLACTCGRGNGTFRKRWRHGNCPKHGARQTRDLSIIFLRPLASPVACLNIYLGLLHVQAEYMRVKLNISRLLSMWGSRICTDASQRHERG